MGRFGDRAIGRAGRVARILAAAALALAGHAEAGPPAGTVIPNQATGSALVGVTPIPATSNTVQLVVGGGATSGYSASLVASSAIDSDPGRTVYFSHTLTNTGTLPDSYTLALADAPLGFGFASFAMFPDADGNGVPDGAVPVANPVALAPGASFRFVVRATIPANAPVATQDSVLVSAASAGGASIASNTDLVRLLDRTVPLDCASATKWIERDRGPSPAGPITITISYIPCDKARSRLEVIDRLPAGMRYVAASARWSATGATVLTDGVVGADRQGPGPTQIAYDFGVSTAGAVTFRIHDIPAEASGQVTFQVEIAPGLAAGTIVPNAASYAWYDAAGARGYTQDTNTVTYTVTSRGGVELTGERLPTATPGTTVAFTNVLTNRGEATDTFEIGFGASTFPPGSAIALFQPDGLTPLADTNGNATPDTGPVAAGASTRIVLRVAIPATALPGVYQVTKTARSASNALVSASADDIVDTLATRCALALDPDNQSTIGRGQHVTYTHYLTNRGNCEETVSAIAGYLADARPGWVSAAYVDNPAAGGASIPGALDATDTPLAAGWRVSLPPGQGLRLLVDVRAPEAAGAEPAAKAVVDSNLTTLTLTASGTGALMVRDTTIVDDKDGPVEPQNAIRNFTDASYQVPTLWAVIGRDAWIRADAASCNAAPDVAETRLVVITGPGGEREEMVATETGPNTGVFLLAAMPIRAPPVSAGNRGLEGRANDVFEMEVIGCGRRIAGTITVTEPVGVVFDSRTNAPVAGARVTLGAASGGQCPGTPVEGAAPAVTGEDGRFAFTVPAAGSYCLSVSGPNGYRFRSQVPWTQLAPGRNLVVTGPTSGGSYGDAFALAAAGGVVVDIPVDAVAQDGLFVQKNALRLVVSLGEFVDYEVRVRNNTGNALDRAPVRLVDDLPAGFAYMRGTARRDGRALDDPAGGGGPRLTFDLGSLQRGEEAAVSYRVRTGPGALQGDGVNRVSATYTANGSTTTSNVATARVQVLGGVFSERGFILGKVFLDCNANGEQDAGEAGVPGVRLFLEDGTFVLTDGGGKFSFYGLVNRTHVLKADGTTLPSGARLAAIGTRNLGDGASRIVDLKAGEMHRADFAVAGCEGAVVDEVKGRAAALAENGGELAALAGTQLATETRTVPDVKALPASGVVSTAAAPGGVAAPSLTDPALASSQSTPFATVFEVPAAVRPTPAPKRTPEPAAPALPPLETLAPDLDATLGFVGLADGETLAYAQTAVRVKGTAGATLRLFVNGAEVPAARIGKRVTVADRRVQAWEFIGVDLRAGDNRLEVAQVDPFGNERGRAAITVRAPGTLGRLAIEVPAGGGIADGRTAAKVVVKLADDNGVPVTVRTPVTLEASLGAWLAKDLDPAEPGLQAFVENGRGEFLLASPLEPGASVVAARSGNLRAEARLDFLPELRSLVAAGVLEGVVNLRNIDPRALVPTRSSDGFEQEIRHLSRDWNDGKSQAGARAAFFLKGKIKGEYLLTAAYDSDKDSRERLFRDIQPDEFYPVYGDSGIRGYDAQSTSRLYVRVDGARSYLLWGDFTTNALGELRKLSNYSRSLTGLRHHYENGRVSLNAFASRDTTRQVIEELRANGTSGPYQLGTASMLVNSEKLELVTRDRNQPALILASVPQARFADYEIEPLTGRILFKSPVASVDKDLNPVFVRATYEVDQGGEEFWVAGVDAQVKLTDRIEVGGTYVEDRNPQQPFKLAGANAVARLGEGTFVFGEVAQTERGAEGTKGQAARLELKHESKDLRAQAFVAKSDREFENPGAWLTQGRGEAGGRIEYRVRPGTTLRGEALRTEDVNTGAVRDGAVAAVEQALPNGMTLEVGVRHAAEKGAASPVPPVAGQPAPQPMPDEVTTVRARLTGAIPGVEGASVYGEAEVDVADADRRVLAAGGEYRLANRGRIYARHEFISSITGPYGLNATERQNTTAVGVDTEYMRDGRLFSEYRIRDAISGGDAEAAIGLKNLWTLAPGLRLGTNLERVHSLSGTGQNENTALALALEYTANESWKGTTRLELRDASTTESVLWTVGLAARLARDWTALARNAWSLQRNKDGGAEKVIERLQAGLAWRDNETNKWNALGRVEYRLEQDDTLPGIELKAATTLVSLHADWQPRRPFLLTARYAAKWTTDQSNGLTTKYRAQLLGGRATWEFAPRWDVGLAVSALFGDSADSRHYGVGVELGYLVTTNLWVSAGYNFFGYRDADLSGADYTAKGPYLRLRYKFDETLLENAAGRLPQ